MKTSENIKLVSECRTGVRGGGTKESLKRRKTTGLEELFYRSHTENKL